MRMLFNRKEDKGIKGLRSPQIKEPPKITVVELGGGRG